MIEFTLYRRGEVFGGAVTVRDDLVIAPPMSDFDAIPTGNFTTPKMPCGPYVPADFVIQIECVSVQPLWPTVNNEWVRIVARPVINGVRIGSPRPGGLYVGEPMMSVPSCAIVYPALTTDKTNPLGDVYLLTIGRI